MPADEILRANHDAAVQALHEILSTPEAGEVATAIAGKALTTIFARRMGVPERAIEGRVAVKIEGPGPNNPSLQKVWAKWVMAVDEKIDTGFAFDGVFLKPGLTHSLPPGACVLIRQIRDPSYSRRNETLACVVREQQVGGLDVVARHQGAGWVKPISKAIKALLDERGRQARLDIPAAAE